MRPDQRTVKKVFRRAGTNSFPLLPSSTTTYVDANFEVRDSDQPVKYVCNDGTRVVAATGSLDATAPRLQRFRVLPGWNLLSIAVDAPDAAQQLGLGRDPSLQSIHRWLAAPGRFAAMNPSDPLPAGSVFWVYMREGGTLHVVGTLSSVVPPMAAPGPHYQPVLGLRSPTLAGLVPPQANQVWRFDSSEQHWQTRLPSLFGLADPLPARLAPDEAVFYTTPVSATVPVPDPATGLQYLHGDHLNSVTCRTDALGGLAQTILYYPFGEVRKETDFSDISDACKFSQKEADEESRLQYFEARYLAANTGRFMSVEPVARGIAPAMLADPQSLNCYAYARNNPLNFNDPDGRLTFGISTAIGALCGTAGGVAKAEWVVYSANKEVPGTFNKQQKKQLRKYLMVIGGLKGAAVGLVVDTLGAALPILIAANATAEAVGNVSAYIAKQVTLNREINGVDIAKTFVSGALSGAAGTATGFGIGSAIGSSSSPNVGQLLLEKGVPTAGNLATGGAAGYGVDKATGFEAPTAKGLEAFASAAAGVFEQHVEQRARTSASKFATLHSTEHSPAKSLGQGAGKFIKAHEAARASTK